MLVEMYDWIKVYPSGIASGYKNALEITKEYGVKVYEIGGTDFINKTKTFNGRNIICIARKDNKLIHQNNLIIIKDEVRNISSTMIRNMIKNIKEIDDKKIDKNNLTEPNIIRYIIKNNLLNGIK